MANLVLASKRVTKSGRNMWHVYARVENTENGTQDKNNTKQDEFWFPVEKSVKALRYAFILRKKHNAIIPKAIYSNLMAEVKTSKPEEVPSTEQDTESAPKKKGTRKRTAKKEDTNTENK